MKMITKKPLVLALGIAITLALPTYSFANGTPSFVTTEASNSANAMFIVDQNGLALEVMTEFGYFRSTTQGSISEIPVPVDPGGAVVTEPVIGGPFVPGNSEHAYLILNVMPMLPISIPSPEPIPVPFPEPAPVITEPVTGPGNPIVDPIIEPIINPIVDPGPGGTFPDLPPVEPFPVPVEPAYDVLYFELTPAQIMITNSTTSIEVDTCQQPQPSMYFDQCGTILVSWTNTANESMKSSTNTLTKTSNGVFGQPMTIKGTSAQFYSSASATMSVMGLALTNDFAGRSAARSKQEFHLDNEIIILN